MILYMYVMCVPKYKQRILRNIEVVVIYINVNVIHSSNVLQVFIIENK